MSKSRLHGPFGSKKHAIQGPDGRPVLFSPHDVLIGQHQGNGPLPATGQVDKMLRNVTLLKKLVSLSQETGTPSQRLSCSIGLIHCQKRARALCLPCEDQAWTGGLGHRTKPVHESIYSITLTCCQQKSPAPPERKAESFFDRKPVPPASLGGGWQRRWVGGTL